MEKEFKSCALSEKHSVHKKLLIMHDNLATKTFKEKYDENSPFISTHSNPSSNELKEILETIGVESDIFETKKECIRVYLLQPTFEIFYLLMLHTLMLCMKNHKFHISNETTKNSLFHWK